METRLDSMAKEAGKPQLLRQWSGISRYSAVGFPPTIFSCQVPLLCDHSNVVIQNSSVSLILYLAAEFRR